MRHLYFSVILPVRNGGNYVKTCVRSVLDQTYPFFNLIVLDNFSTDGTLEWLQNLQNDNIIIHRSSEPLTIEYNWARILTIEKNEFIILIGHDDILEPNYLETIFGLINKYPDASIYTTHFNFIDASGHTIRPCKPIDEKQSAPDFLASLLTHRIDLVGTGYTMRSKDYDTIGGIPVYYPNLLFADLNLYHQLSCISYKAAASENCFSFRLHQSTTFTTDDSKFQEAFKLIINYFLKLKFFSEEFAYVIYKYSNMFILYYCKSLTHRMVKNNNDKKEHLSVRKFVDDCKAYAKQLAPSSAFYPEKNIGIQLAILIDNNVVARILFKLFKKMYAKPVFKS